eukprot:4055610-Prymnesium_polylepis.1
MAVDAAKMCDELKQVFTELHATVDALHDAGKEQAREIEAVASALSEAATDNTLGMWKRFLDALKFAVRSRDSSRARPAPAAPR